MKGTEQERRSRRMIACRVLGKSGRPPKPKVPKKRPKEPGKAWGEPKSLKEASQSMRMQRTQHGGIREVLMPGKRVMRLTTHLPTASSAADNWRTSCSFSVRETIMAVAAPWLVRLPASSVKA